MLTKREEVAQTRRRFLQTAGLLTLSASTVSITPDRKVKAQVETLGAPAMRQPRERVAAAGATMPELPPLEVIALNRMGFGPRPGDLSAFRALGSTDSERLSAHIAQQLDPASIDDSECDAIIAGHGFSTLDKSLTQLWADHHAVDGISWDERTKPVRETQHVTFLRAIYSKRQLQEVLADFWHNHFNVYGWDYWSAPVWVHYDRDVIRANMLGNFRDLLTAVAQSPAMLYYLDNQTNSGGNPNENYARELFEVHSMGAENYLGVIPLQIGDNGQFVHPAPLGEDGIPSRYVDADVYGATTCFTGWHVGRDTGLFEFDASAHFPYQKFVLGQAVPDSQGVQDGHDVLALLANHPGTARYIPRKLCRRLVSDTPSETLVQTAADVFLDQRNAPDQLSQVVRTILLSDEFAKTWGEKVKRPFKFCVSLFASAGDFEPDDHFFWRYNRTGQPLFQWRMPDGYPDFHEDWTSTMPMLQRWRLANWLLEWKFEGSDERRIRFAHPSEYRTPVDIVNYWSYVLLGLILPDVERWPIVEFMAYGRNPNSDLPDDQIEERLRYMIGLIFASPSFQWR